MSSVIPPDLNLMLRRTFAKAQDCKACAKCASCGPERATNPLAWCEACLKHDCKTLGRFGMGTLGPALLFPHRLEAFDRIDGIDYLRLSGIRLACRAATLDHKPVEQLVGQFVSSWVEFNGLTRIEPIPGEVLTKITTATGWRF